MDSLGHGDQQERVNRNPTYNQEGSTFPDGIHAGGNVNQVGNIGRDAHFCKLISNIFFFITQLSILC